MAWRPAKKTYFPLRYFRRSPGIIFSPGMESPGSMKQQFPIVLLVSDPVFLFAGCSKRCRGEAREKIEERRRTYTVRWSEAIERNEAYEAFSAVCWLDDFIQRILNNSYRSVLNQLRNQIPHHIFRDHALHRVPLHAFKRGRLIQGRNSWGGNARNKLDELVQISLGDIQLDADFVLRGKSALK